MDKFKWLNILLFSLIAFTPLFSNVSGQIYSLEQFKEPQYPPHTELIDRKTETIKSMQVTSLRYLSELSQNEVVDFYQNIFVSEEGFKEKEQRKSDRNTVLNFVYGDGTIMRAVLVVFKTYAKDFTEELGGKTSYYLTITENNDLLGLSMFQPERPKILNFAPVYQTAEQYCFFDKLLQWKVATYLAKGEPDEIATFYRKEMPGFKWELIKEQSFEGQFNLLDALVMGDTNSKTKISGEEKWPGIDLNLKKIVLTFTNEAKHEECVIHIIQFNDSPEVLKEKHIDPVPLEKYGNTFINLIVYNKDKEAQ